MSEARAVIEGLLRLAAADARQVARARKRNGLLYAIAGVCAVMAFVLAVAAAVIWVARHADPVLAAGVGAAILASVSLTVLAVVAVLNRRERRWMAQRADFYQGAGSTVARALLGPRLSALAAVAMMLGALMGRPERGKGAAPPPPHAPAGHDG